MDGYDLSNPRRRGGIIERERERESESERESERERERERESVCVCDVSYIRQGV
jgi:hypothetical protein